MIGACTRRRSRPRSSGATRRSTRSTAFLGDRDALPASLVIEGPAGAGKSTLWQAAVDDAAEAGYAVLACRPAGAEVQLSLAALADLLEPHLDGVLAELPVPQAPGARGGAPPARRRGPRPRTSARSRPGRSARSERWRESARSRSRSTTPSGSTARRPRSSRSCSAGCATRLWPSSRRGAPSRSS